MEPPVAEDQGGLEEGELIGQVIGGKYELERYVGRGASGSVYGARHRILEKVVALKILDPDMARSASLVELFKREARAASRIDHPNSVRVLDFGKDASGLLYIVMEFVEGPDLLQVLSEEFPLELARVIEIMSQVLAALSVAHELGIVHRDLKPENILVLSGTSDEGSPTDLIKICDFGIAQLSPTAVPYQLSPRSSLQQPAAIDLDALVGTPEYMSPEQARNEALDARSDLYSAGILLFQLVTGRLPFMAEAPEVVAIMQCSAQPPHPSWFIGVDPRIDAICLKALSKDPKDRYQSAREMRAALRQLALSPEGWRAERAPGGVSVAATASSQSMSPPPSLPVAARSQFRMRQMALALVLLAVSGAAAAYVWPAASDASPTSGALSLQASAVAVAERPPETLVAQNEPEALPLAKDVTLSRPLAIDRLFTPRALRPSETPSSRPEERSGRSHARISKSVAVTAASPSETAIGSAPAIPEAPKAEPEAATALEEQPQAETVTAAAQEPSAGSAVPSGSKDVSAQGAALPSLMDLPLVSAQAVSAAPKPEPFEAVARIQHVTVRGSLATSVVQRAMDRARPRLAACYAQSAKAAGRNAYGSMSIEVEFDERGRAHWSRVGGGPLPGLDRCVTEVAANLIAAQAPDTGTVMATWQVSFER